MISTKDVLEWLKPLFTEVPKWGNGNIDKNAAEVVGVYTRRNGFSQPVALGRLETYGIKSISLLVHWSKSSSTCEAKAIEIYEKLKDLGTEETIGAHSCWISGLRAPEPLGRDDLGYFESLIDFEIYFRKVN